MLGGGNGWILFLHPAPAFTHVQAKESWDEAGHGCLAVRKRSYVELRRTHGVRIVEIRVRSVILL